jgi:hypothetical protein
MRRPSPEVLELDVGQLAALLDRTKAVLDAADWETLKAMANTLVWLMGELEKKRVDISRLREFVFGSKKTEKTSTVLEKKDPKNSEAKPSDGAEEPTNRRRKGHGRNGADAYWGASRTPIGVPRGFRCHTRRLSPAAPARSAGRGRSTSWPNRAEWCG